MLQLIREYIKYRRKAKRRHGIHSPFVYEFGDQCLSIPVPKLIQKKAIGVWKNENSRAHGFFRKRKIVKLIYRLFAHYSLQNVLLDTSCRAWINVLMEGVDFKGNVTDFPFLNHNDTTPFDMIILNALTTEWTDFTKIITNNIHDETFVVVLGIRATSSAFMKWEKLVENPSLHLSIDRFETGILVKRHHQQKEHFVIR